MSNIALYPLRFDPIYQCRPWGGRRLAHWLASPLPGEGAVGEAWVLSDRDEFPSRIADGPLKGQTIKQLIESSSIPLLGKLAGHFRRFPLLLKFLDVRDRLSVQVHPSGDSAKTEAWVVLEQGPKARIYAGLKPATNTDDLRRAITNGNLAHYLAGFMPRTGDGVLLRAGTVHSLSDVVVFEVQQNSDVTLRLYDWDNVNPKTGLRRPLQIDEALAQMRSPQSAVHRVEAVVEERRPVMRERVLLCEQFGVWRLHGESPFPVGAADTPRVLVCIAGDCELEFDGSRYPFGTGDALLLPAVVGACCCHAFNDASVLEISLPDVQ